MISENVSFDILSVQFDPQGFSLDFPLVPDVAAQVESTGALTGDLTIQIFNRLPEQLSYSRQSRCRGTPQLLIQPSVTHIRICHLKSFAQEKVQQFVSGFIAFSCLAERHLSSTTQQDKTAPIQFRLDRWTAAAFLTVLDCV